MGFLARLSSAEMVLVGAAVLGGVVRVKSWPQRVLSPATPPVVLMQAERMSARVLMVVTGACWPAGMLLPGAVPSEGSANWPARPKALTRAATSVLAEPDGAERRHVRSERVETAATVVTSLIWMKVVGVSGIARAERGHHGEVGVVAAEAGVAAGGGDVDLRGRGA